MDSPCYQTKKTLQKFLSCYFRNSFSPNVSFIHLAGIGLEAERKAESKELKKNIQKSAQRAHKSVEIGIIHGDIEHFLV